MQMQSQKQMQHLQRCQTGEHGNALLSHAAERESGRETESEREAD